MNYYYLIASLPELSLDDPLPVVDVAKTLQIIRGNLVKEDLKLSNYLIYPNDNRNLTNLIFEKSHNCSLPVFRSPSVFSTGELIHSMKTGYDLPSYMMEYLVKYKEHFQQLSPGLVSEYLWTEFYEEVATLGHPFINDYFQFDKLLRQMAAAHNYDLIEEHVANNLVDELIIKQLGSRKTDSSLAKTYPFIEKLWESLDSHDPMIIEKNMDEVRWGFIDNYELVQNFTSTQLFGWILKLMHYSRWAGLDKEKGKIRFEKICDEAIQASGISEIEQL